MTFIKVKINYNPSSTDVNYTSTNINFFFFKKNNFCSNGRNNG